MVYHGEEMKTTDYQIFIYRNTGKAENTMWDLFGNI